MLFVILVVYLGTKALREDAWDGWAVGSAQIAMSTKHWVEDGFVYSKFLLLPIGYSKTVRYLDEPEMRHHARGTITGEIIGRRLYYTHYPPGYLIPYALLATFGFEERHWLTLLALVFSLGGLTLMYILFCLISNKTLAFLATLYYGASTMFLDYAGTLSNQSFDDLLRFLILVLSVLAVRQVSGSKKYRIYNVLLWVFYFILAISSYDSTFFIFVWLVGLDIITFRKFLWKRWLFWASAPVAAFLLQMAQNAWYLGFHDMLLDAYGSFKFRAGTGPGSNIFTRHIRAIFSPLTHLTDFRARFAIPLVSAVFLLFWKFRNTVSSYEWPKIKILVLFALAGFAYPFIFTSSGYFPYQGRQMAPFVGLLIACSMIVIFKNIKKETIKKPSVVILLVVFFALTAGLWFSQGARTYAYVKDWPNNKVDKNIIEFAALLKNIRDDNDAVVFRMDNTEPYRYSQIAAVTEYYIDMPVLSFKNTSDLIDDFKWLKNRSEFPFYSIILVNSSEEAETIKKGIGPANENYKILISPGINFYI